MRDSKDPKSAWGPIAADLAKEAAPADRVREAVEPAQEACESELGEPESAVLARESAERAKGAQPGASEMEWAPVVAWVKAQAPAPVLAMGVWGPELELEA